MLGCQDFGLKVFDQFYFSRTRRSLEYYYAQANVSNDEESLSQDQTNYFGNYAMIGSEANSSGSNWSPKTKLDHYLDPSGKIAQISVASLKFMVMMQICKDNQKWFAVEDVPCDVFSLPFGGCACARVCVSFKIARYYD